MITPEQTMLVICERAPISAFNLVLKQGQECVHGEVTLRTV